MAATPRRHVAAPPPARPPDPRRSVIIGLSGAAMLFLLSPAKTLDEKAAAAHLHPTQPLFPADADALAAQLAKLTPAALRELMSVNAGLAELNRKRFAGFATATAKPCVVSYNGPAYKALAAAELPAEQLAWVQLRLRILSGLYGVLRPLDAMKPYRLEMGCKFGNAHGKDLYAYWRDRVAKAVLADVAALPAGERCLVNVASGEYFAVVKPFVEKLADCPLYTMVFRGATVYVKGARGAIVRYAAQIGATRPEQLRGFMGLQGEWRFVASASDERSYVFERGQPAKPAAAAKAKAKRGAEAEAEDDDAAPAKRGARRR